MDFTTLQNVSPVYPMYIKQYKDTLLDPNSDVQTKMNSVVQSLNQLSQNENDLVNNWNKVMQWAMNDGLDAAVSTQMTALENSGYFNSLLTSLFNSELGTETLATTSQDIKGAINEVKGVADSNTSALADIATNVRNFPIQIPETDDTARINRAIASITSGTVSIPNGTYNISGNGLSVPNGINFVMSPSALIIYTGTGTAITLDHNLNGKHVIGKLQRKTLDWKTGVDTSSVGIRLSSANYTSVHVSQCLNFNVGIQMYSLGDGSGVNAYGGTCYNTLTLGQITDNKIGIQFLQSNSGWANGNTFIGGAIRINSNNVGVVGSKYIDLSTTGNGNLFNGINMEGSAQEKTVEIAYSNNTFVNCRMELNPQSSWHFMTTSTNNQIIGGYGNFGYDSKPQGDGKKLFFDEGVGNFILGGRGLKLFGDSGTYGSGTALALQGAVSGSDILLRGYNFQGKAFTKLTASGIFSSFGSGGEYDVNTNPTGQAYPMININPTTYSIETGQTDGSQAPTPLIAVFTPTRADLKKTLYVNGGRIAGNFVLLSSATPDVSTSNIFKTNNTATTTITNFINGTTGQEIIIIGNDTFTTIANNASIVLQGGVNITLKVNDVIKLIKLDTGAWIESSRNIK